MANAELSRGDKEKIQSEFPALGDDDIKEITNFKMLIEKLTEKYPYSREQALQAVHNRLRDLLSDTGWGGERGSENDWD